MIIERLIQVTHREPAALLPSPFRRAIDLAHRLTRDVFTEAKGNGYCVKTILEILKLRKHDTSAREEAETILDKYLRALEMTPDLFDED